MRRFGLAALVGILIMLAAPAAAALAQQCPRTTLADIEDEVMCPVCGTPLALATEAPQAQRQREFIEGLIAECRSKTEVKEALVAEFGDGVLALPGDSASDEDDLGDTLVYVIPALAFLLAAGGIAFAVVRWRGRHGGPRGQAPSAATAEGARLDTDMERYDL